MKYIILSILVIFTLGSCRLTKDQRIKKRASQKIQKLDRKAKRIAFEHDLLRQDTVKTVVKYVTEPTKVDTILESITDTVTIVKENMTVKLVQKDSLIYLDAICDTIAIHDTVMVQTELIGPVRYIETPIAPWKKYLMWAGGILIILLILAILFRIVGFLS